MVRWTTVRQRHYMTRTHVLRLAALLCVVALAAAACTSDGSGETAQGATDSAAGGTGEEVADVDQEATAGPSLVEEAAARVEEYTGPREARPPEELNPPTRDDVTVGVVSCLQAAEGCARVARGVEAGALAMGWKALIIDGEGTAEGQSKAFANALSAGVDAVVLAVVDAQAVESEIERARQQGVLVIGAYGHDTDPPLFDAQTGITMEESEDDGRAIADYVIAESGGEAQVALFRGDDFVTVAARGDGFEERFAECDGCEIVDTQQFVVTDITTRLPTLAINTMQANPDITWIVSTYDIASEFILQGVQQAGLAEGVRIVSFDGNASTSSLIRDGSPIEVTAASAAECYGWHTIDVINSLLAGDPAAEAGCPDEPKLIVADNAPAEGNWQGDVDWEELYRQRWEVER